MQDTIIKNTMQRADRTKDFSIEKNYRNNEVLRASFNRLAEKTFGLNFENWYRNGFWKDNYIPYSVVIDGEVVSNVSVNACNMNYKGQIVKLIQLGTIMTDDDYRRNGYARALMEEVLKDYDGKVDGIYLFANDSVLEFYPKFGFKEAKEYQFTKDVTISGECTAQNVPLRDKIDFDRTVEILDTKKQNAQLYMVDNPGLYMFYLSQFMTENLFYIEECNSYAIAEVEDDTLILHAIIGAGAVDEVIRAFGSQVKKVILCFTPNDVRGFEKSELHEEDTTFFVQGKFFEDSRGDEYMMQAITHA
ncbi:GNAT family N-acetyltransferase [Butyrivibrio sp.]|jgi:predicted acetyltransferase|uniref:GNAT family N-acetyltransferase n=1 Tax=Butyrivibrio sp. TaxID=28121 RepID=UPI0025C33FCE|nr:GNAT family N-acetyltransferase [Butyrivibrio sp.]MBE5837724.1 GNAT family N-acetyltransferase [Butyrivibrio sp.]